MTHKRNVHPGDLVYYVPPPVGVPLFIWRRWWRWRGGLVDQRGLPIEGRPSRVPIGIYAGENEDGAPVLLIQGTMRAPMEGAAYISAPTRRHRWCARLARFGDTVRALILRESA